MAAFKVLSTKKLEAALLHQAEANDIALSEVEFIATRPVLSKEKWNEISEVLESKLRYAVFTSANAVEAVKKYLHEYVSMESPEWQIFCISGKTRATIEQAKVDFGTVIHTAEYGMELAEKIIDHGVKELVFFCGNLRREEPLQCMRSAGIVVREIIVYETELSPSLIEESFDAVLFFSPSAVQSFFSMNHIDNATTCFAIGETTADAIRQFTTNEVIVSPYPDQQTLMQQLFDHQKKHKQ